MSKTCDMPGCQGKRQILLMEDEMRCICHKCWQKLGATSLTDPITDAPSDNGNPISDRAHNWTVPEAPQ